MNSHKKVIEVLSQVHNANIAMELLFIIAQNNPMAVINAYTVLHPAAPYSVLDYVREHLQSKFTKLACIRWYRHVVQCNLHAAKATMDALGEFGSQQLLDEDFLKYTEQCKALLT